MQAAPNRGGLFACPVSVSYAKATVVGEMSMSLDGCIAQPDDSVGPLFGWYGNGPVPVPLPGAGGPDAVHVSEASAGHVRMLLDHLGALVSA